MSDGPATGNESIDFTCPRCGACAFEIVEIDRSSRDKEDAGVGTVIVMKCLNCLEFYQYQSDNEADVEALVEAR